MKPRKRQFCLTPVNYHPVVAIWADWPPEHSALCWKLSCHPQCSCYFEGTEWWWVEEYFHPPILSVSISQTSIPETVDNCILVVILQRKINELSSQITLGNSRLNKGKAISIPSYLGGAYHTHIYSQCLSTLNGIGAFFMSYLFTAPKGTHKIAGRLQNHTGLPCLLEGTSGLHI